MHSKKRLFLGALLLVLLFSGCAKSGEKTYFQTIADFQAADTVAFANAASNSCYNGLIQQDIPNVKFYPYTNYFDTFLEVAGGKRDAALCFGSIFVGIQNAYPSLDCVLSEQTVPIAAVFSDKQTQLKGTFDTYVTSHPQVLAELKEKWVDDYGNNDYTVDFSNLENRNGNILFALAPDSPPMEYLKNGELAGFEVDLLYRFAQDCGYSVTPIITEYDAALSGIATGKYDFAVGFYGCTQERSEGILFSEPYYNEHLGYVVQGKRQESRLSLSQRFENNFLRESRWKLIADGLKTTVAITVLTVLLGSGVGFCLFLLGRKNLLLQTLFFRINELFESLPTLVILLVFFYVIFGDSSISGFAVAAGVFSLLFCFTFFALLTGSVNGIDRGQTEAALALGYTPFQALSRVVIPQAMVSFLPAYKSAIVGVLKATAVVGYVAVQDLTMAGDHIRSLTFDALFPIVGIAILYFIIARLLIWGLNRIFRIDYKKNR